MLSASLKDLIVWAGFKLNQSYITKNICVKRAEQITVCGGSCYLQEQLLAIRYADYQKDQEDPPQMIETIDIKLYQAQLDIIDLNRKDYLINDDQFSQYLSSLSSKDITNKMLRPPQV